MDVRWPRKARAGILVPHVALGVPCHAEVGATGARTIAFLFSIMQNRPSTNQANAWKFKHLFDHFGTLPIGIYLWDRRELAKRSA